MDGPGLDPVEIFVDERSVGRFFRFQRILFDKNAVSPDEYRVLAVRVESGNAFLRPGFRKPRVFGVVNADFNRRTVGEPVFGTRFRKQSLGT